MMAYNIHNIFISVSFHFIVTIILGHMRINPLYTYSSEEETACVETLTTHTPGPLGIQLPSHCPVQSPSADVLPQGHWLPQEGH